MSKHFESSISSEPVNEIVGDDIKKTPTEIVDEYFNFLKKYWGLEKTWNAERAINEETCSYELFEKYAKNKLLSLIKDL